VTYIILPKLLINADNNLFITYFQNIGVFAPMGNESYNESPKTLIYQFEDVFIKEYLSLRNLQFSRSKYWLVGNSHSPAVSR